jgi:hypothetical protein
VRSTAQGFTSSQALAGAAGPKLIVMALTTNDYHEHVKLEGDVPVVSIEDVPEGEYGS